MSHDKIIAINDLWIKALEETVQELKDWDITA